MTLPTPNLDDRRFQDIVDEAKRLIPRYCPEWTDHNVSDPGVTLVELFAWMTEMIIYRLNQVPDVLYTKFLELVGLQLFPGAPARVELTFWLSAPQPEPVTIPAGTQVGTVRTGQEESVVFITNSALLVRQPELIACLTGTDQGRYKDCWADLRAPRERVTAFPTVRSGDAIYFGFADGLASNLIRLDVEARIEGIGVDPDRPPWSWEAWTGDGWAPARLLSDGTRGLNTDGALELILPDRHGPLTLGPTRAHWLRCRMLEPVGDQPAYENSPEVVTVAVTGLGGSAWAHHGQPVAAETLGHSDGEPGQRFRLRRAPVLSRQPHEVIETIEVTPQGVRRQRWQEVEAFTDSGDTGRHVVWDAATGEIRFGPRIRYPDGTVVQHGAVPPIDSEVVVTGYRTGGGRRGNVGAHTIRVLKTSIPFVAEVSNIDPARGGVDPESVENARMRGPLALRTGQRAVTADDYERLTLEASADVARARCLPPEESGGPIRVFVIPRLHVTPEELTLDDLALPDELEREVTGYLDERRTLTTRVEVGTPSYQGVTVVAALRAAPGSSADLLRDHALSTLYRYLNPLVGGAEGEGWPYGRTLTVGELFALLAGIEGVVGVEEVLIFLTDLRTGDVDTGEGGRGHQRVRLPADTLFASHRHQVRVL